MASGRFGVDAEYLMNADELQIKMAQGAKPGEGGQLMGKKVTKEIAEIRYGKPGNDLISPPPHHDIYSIEDLAQLIYDLKAIKPGVPVSVKLVAVENIGTIAVGVAKAGADVIEIDGIDGGTGAAMVSSKEHAGLPSEMGLGRGAPGAGGQRAAQRRAAARRRRDQERVRRRQVRPVRGRASSASARALMVSVGCIVCKICHIPNCPTGITGSPEIFKGHPEHTKAYLTAAWPRKSRQLLAQMGFKHLPEIVGRSDLLVKSTDLTGRAALVDVSRFIQPDMALARLEERSRRRPARPACARRRREQSLNARILAAAHDAIDTGQNADLVFRIRNARPLGRGDGGRA